MPPDAVGPAEIHRALIIKFGHHGDALLASPVLSALKTAAPQAKIDALVYAETADMLSLHPALDCLHVIDQSWKTLGWLPRLRHEWAVLQQLRQRRYDLIIHLSDHWRGARIVQACKPRWSVAPAHKQRGKAWARVFSHLVASPRTGFRHTVEANLDALRRIGIYPAIEDKRLCLIPGAPAQARAHALLTELHRTPGDFVHIHPASRWRFKCWPAAHMAQLITRLEEAGLPVLLTAAPGSTEAAMVTAIQAHLTSPVAALVGVLSLKELAAISALARLFIGVDSAPMHIAAAMNTPLIALFGPSGEGHWAPWMANPAMCRVLADNHWRCRPCGIDGCGGGKRAECLHSLTPDTVFAACQELLAQPRSINSP